MEPRRGRGTLLLVQLIRTPGGAAGAWRWLLALALASLVLVLPAGAEVAPGAVVAWGCGSACVVPSEAASGVVAISGGPWHSLALEQSGNVVAWGCGPGTFDAGQCTVPVEASSGVTAIAAGTFHNVAVKTGTGVIAWGCGGAAFADDGQCTVPAGAAAGVTAIAAGDRHSLALKGGTVLAWGCRTQDYGQCTVPPAAGGGVTAIAAASVHSLALGQDGGAIAWGCGRGIDFGQCAVPAAAQAGATAIAAGTFHNLALKQDGSVVAWGCGTVVFGGTLFVSGDYGQCTVPEAATSGVTAIAAGGTYSLALKQDGSVIAWGCGGVEGGVCTVPTSLAGGVTAIAAGGYGLALTQPPDPTALLEQLAARVAGVGPGNGLAAIVQQAQRAHARGATAAACGLMTAFGGEVRAQSGKTIEAGLARALIADADAVTRSLGC